MLNQFDVIPTLPSADLGTARAFYEGLGFTRIEQEGPEEFLGVLYATGSTRFLIYPSAYAGTNKATAMGFELPAERFDAVVAALHGQGVTFDTFQVPDGTWENGTLTGFGMKSAWFHDPDENIININAPL